MNGGAHARIDVAGALARMGGSRELLDRLIGEFCDKEADLSRATRMLADAGQFAEARQRVHGAKGTAMVLGLNDFSKAAAAVEGALRRGDGAACVPLWPVLERELAKALDACRRRPAVAPDAGIATAAATHAAEPAAAVLKRLTAALERSSMSAIADAEALATSLAGTPHAEAAMQIRELLYGLDYDAALRRAGELAHALALRPA